MSQFAYQAASGTASSQQNGCLIYPARLPQFHPYISRFDWVDTYFPRILTFK